MMASIEVFDRDGMNGNNDIGYMLNRTAIWNFRASHKSTHRRYESQDGALYVASVNGRVFGFVGPDNAEFYTTLGDRFLKRFPATDTDVPVMDIPTRPITFTKRVM